MPPKHKSKQKKSKSKKVTPIPKESTPTRNQPPSGQPSKKSPRKTEVTIHPKIMLLIKLGPDITCHQVLIDWSWCFNHQMAHGLTELKCLLWKWEGSCYDGYQSPKSIHLKHQPNPVSDEGLIQHFYLSTMTRVNKHHQESKPNLTGFGLTNNDLKVGISKIDGKLETMCPHYHAMNKLMGD
ncbi:hypothetical protein VP01_881g6 [Puccinia sorghi]|uniref:Uncharacterized protein n=1 Tax=Puccinia sorghi TaxID=27349 RepID=A0A0L6U8B9_9BASI|nr:hypothetical protein VP01_881g6 [Puccinia sorghi]